MQKEYIDKKINKLQTFLKKFLLEQSVKYKNNSSWALDIENKILPFALSGKNMRGLLVLLNSKKEDSNILKLASAIELLHSAFLIHDDIMDKDEKRRGEDSVYIKYANQFKNQNKIHYGISQAISLGDICIFLAFDLVNQIKHKNKEKIISFFVEEIIKVGFGQMQDVFVSFDKKEPELKDIIEIYRFKTARYSISLPLSLGYLLNENYNKNILNNIISAGEYLGIAFQMKDDYLGIWGDSINTGKGILKDVNKNKRTIIKYLLMQNSSKKDELFIQDIFGKENLSKTEIQDLFILLEKHNIKEKHNLLLDEYNQKANLFIKKLPNNFQEILLFLEDFNNQRIK